MRILACAVLIAFSSMVWGAEHAMVVEVYPLGLADYETSLELAKSIVSPEGKLVEDRPGNRLIILDYPEKQAALSKAFKTVRAPQYNVRVRVTFDEQGAVRSDGVGVQGGFRVGNTQVKPDENPSNPNARVQIDSLEATRASIVQQELLVVSGGRGRLRIGTEVPYLDWFWNYGIQAGLWGKEVRWKEVGAQMAVEPYVSGQRVRLRLTPEFSYVVNGENLTTAVEKLATEVWVNNGQEIDIGGLPVSDREFYSRFLVGYNHLGEKRSLSIRVKPEIEPLEPP